MSFDPSVRTCSRCCRDKPGAEFCKASDRPSGLKRYCLACDRERRARKSVPPPSAKYCRSCKETKPAADFYASRSRTDGLRDECKACCRAYKRAKREAINAANRERRKQHPERYAEYQRSFWDRLKAEGRYEEYQQRYSGRYAKRQQEWRKANPEKTRATAARYRARKGGNRGHYTAEQWEAMLDFYERTCLCCGAQDVMTFDHVVPISKGGDNTVANGQPLCGPCNYSKNARTVDFRDAQMHAEFMGALEAHEMV